MFKLDRLFKADDTDYQAINEEIKSGKAQLVDIREKMEWDQFRFKGAVNVPLSRLAKGIDIDKLKQIKNRNKMIYLHCHTGSRVRMADRLLRNLGCTEFKILPTTMNNMANNGFELAA